MKLAKIKRSIRKYVLGYDVPTYFFSQGGEDMIVQNIFKRYIREGVKGSYVDVGAYHPYKFSNTYFLYRLGWRGVNIDPNPHAISLFEKYRPDDINLNFGIGTQNSSATYYILNEHSSMNSFSKEHLNSLGLANKVKSEMEVPIYTLKHVFDMYGKTMRSIDFLNIDIEGMDYDVIVSNDWKKYKPTVIAIELEGETIEDLLTHQVYHFLSNNNYKFIAKNYLLRNISTVFFMHDSMEV